MNTAKRVTLNSFLSITLDIIAKATRALVFIMIARHLGPEETGAFAIAISFQAIFQAFTMGGADYYLIREVAKDKKRANVFFTHFIVMKCVLSLVSWAVLILLLSTVLHYSSATTLVIILLAFAILPEGIDEVNRAIFVAFESLLFPTIVAGLLGIVRLGLSYWVLSQGMGIEPVVWITIGISFLNAMANLIIIFSKFTKPVLTLSWNFMRQSFSESFPFMGIGILRVLEFNIAILMLSLISGERAVGIYNAGYTLVLALLLASEGYTNGALPLLSRLYAESLYTKLSLFYRKSIQIMWAFAMPLTIGLIQLSAFFILRIYTPSFTDTISVLQMLSLIVLLTLFTAPHSCIILAAHKQSLMFWANLISIVVNIVAGILLMPKLGAFGAAIARVIATIVLAASYEVIVQTRIIKNNLSHLIGPLALAGGIMAGLAWLLRGSNTWLALSIDGSVYFVLILLLTAFSKEDRQLVLHFIGIDKK
jgi:O-antigen/teichoic acid export membrane protein